MSRNRCNRVLCVDKETHGLVMVEIKKEYLKHHPEREGDMISQQCLVRQMINFYLDPSGKSRR